MATLRTRRVYEPHLPDDGQRVLVDRIWPRGLSKETLQDAVWLKEVAPSTELRKWFGHRSERWEGFRVRYKAELGKNHDAINQLRDMCDRGPVTLLYSARDEERNQAVVIAEYLAAHR